MRTYADNDFYLKEYLLGRPPTLIEEEAPFWLRQASEEIRLRTFDRVEGLEEVPERVKMCCCEVAEKLYRFESAKGENGMILQSFGNDGQTGTYRVDDMTEAATKRAVLSIIKKWLLHTGLMDCGVFE